MARERAVPSVATTYDAHVQHAIAYIDYIDDWTWQAYGWMIEELADWLYEIGWFGGW